MEIARQIQGLESLFKSNRMVLSLYLNNDYHSSHHKRKIWKIRLKNELRRIEHNILAVGNEIEYQSFFLVKHRVLQELKDHTLFFKRGLALFATQDKVVFKDFQLPINDQCYWSEEPVIEPLEELLKKHPRRGVIAVNHETAVVIDVELGEVSLAQSYTFNKNTKRWINSDDKQIQINQQPTPLPHLDKQKKYFDLNLRAAMKLKDLSFIIDTTAQNKKWKGVYLVGPQDVLHELQKTLYVPVVKTHYHNLASQPVNRIVQEILQ